MINLPALSDSELASIDENSPALWMVRLNDQEYGPYFEDSLKAYAHENFELFSDADVRELPHDSWQMYLQSKLKVHAQKSHTQLTSLDELQANQLYYYELNALKSGPINFEKIKEMILKKELHPTDLVSSDDCLTWSKVYHFEELMPFCVPSSGLPEAPLDSTLNQHQESVIEALMDEEVSLKDGLVGLAHYHLQKSGYNNLKLSEVELRHKEASFMWPQFEMSKWAMPAGALASACLVALSVWWTSAPKPQTQKIMVEATPSRVDYTPPQRPLMKQNSPAPRLRVEGSRRPASVQGHLPRIEAKPFMNTRRDLVEYHDTHDYNQDAPEPRETMDAVDDPYNSNAQYAQDMRESEEDRMPASDMAPDDGYRLAPVSQDERVIEEVSDF